MPWTSRDNKGSNDCVYADPHSESEHRDSHEGHFYDGNKYIKASEYVSREGSAGLHLDQGMVRESPIPKDDSDLKGKTRLSFLHTKKMKHQGSHAHLGYRESKVSREL